MLKGFNCSKLGTNCSKMILHGVGRGPFSHGPRHLFCVGRRRHPHRCPQAGLPTQVFPPGAHATGGLPHLAPATLCRGHSHHALLGGEPLGAVGWEGAPVPSPCRGPSPAHWGPRDSPLGARSGTTNTWKSKRSLTAVFLRGKSGLGRFFRLWQKNGFTS